MSLGGKLVALIYEEPGASITAELELSGVPAYDLVGCSGSFDQWTTPNGTLISASRRAEILGRLETWAREANVRIHIGPAITRETLFAALASDGHRVQHKADRTVVVTPKRTR